MIKSRAPILFGTTVRHSSGRAMRGEDWVMMAKRYEDHPEVIGYDIRNEVGSGLDHTKTLGIGDRDPRKTMGIL